MTARAISEHISAIINSKPGKKYILSLLFAFALAIQGFYTIYQTLWQGLGDWNINNDVAWGLSITSFVFWIGIGHAGTLISAILLLFNQKWRLAVNRSAEAMTIIAVLCAAIMPIVHTGRPWFASYWLFSIPNQMDLWPNFKSPLTWDVFAIMTYFIVSLIFWYIGIIPDFAILKRHVKSKILKKIYSFFSFRWSGADVQWRTYKSLYKILAGLAAALVISVHTIVSLDFAAGILQGWHTTVFPPYFVAGAIFSGCAMVISLLIITRSVLGLETYIKTKHFDKLNKIILATSLILLLSYIFEIFSAYWNAGSAESALMNEKLFGTFAIPFWMMLIFNIVLPQLFWFEKYRNNIKLMFLISILINVGMWLERYVIIVSSLSKKLLNDTVANYLPSAQEISIFGGTIGIFLLLYLLFVKFIPVVTMFEIKSEYGKGGDNE